MNELFDDRPAPWTVETFRNSGASIIDANGATVMTVNEAALAGFIADAANAFATDENVFVAADNNADKIAMLTVQRDAANAELARIREWLALKNLCGKTAWEMVYEYTGLVAGHDAEIAAAREQLGTMRTMAQSWLTMATLNDASPRFQGEAEMLRNCARDLTHALDAVMAGGQ